MLEETVEYFLSLKASDRRAIEALLTPAQRQALDRLLARKRERTAAPSAPIADTRAYSRWLKRHLDNLLAEQNDDVTPAARKALRDILCEASP